MCILLACGGGTRAIYTGEKYPVVVSPEGIEEKNQTPTDQIVIGEVTATCEMSDRQDFFGLFSNRSCERAAMDRAMKAEASNAGGQSLVGCRCDTDAESSVDFSSERYTEHSIECHADVTRARALTPPSHIPAALKPALNASPKVTIPSPGANASPEPQKDTGSPEPLDRSAK
jgi:hypothetical protein